MIKKIIAVAVAGISIAPAAHADTASFSVYGELRLGLENINGATSNAVAAAPATSYALAVKGGANTIPSSTLRVVDNTSIFGVKGSENLGGDWLGQFQVEGALHADNGTANPAALNTRDTFVALTQARFGTVLAGQYDTPYKMARGYLTLTPVNFSAAQVSTFWGAEKGSSVFYTRQSDTVQYLSPTWADINFRVGYGPDQSKTLSTNKQRWSFAGFYDGSHAFGSVAYETRAESAPNAVDAVTATAATAGVKIGSGDVALGWEHFHTTGVVAQHNVYLASNWRFLQSWTLGGHYAYAGNSYSASDDSAHNVSVGLQYDFSKRTNVLGYFSRISNSGKGIYNFNINPESGNVIPGQNPQVVGIGINHKF